MGASAIEGRSSSGCRGLVEAGVEAGAVAVVVTAGVGFTDEVVADSKGSLPLGACCSTGFWTGVSTDCVTGCATCVSGSFGLAFAIDCALAFFLSAISSFVFVLLSISTIEGVPFDLFAFPCDSVPTLFSVTGVSSCFTMIGSLCQNQFARQWLNIWTSSLLRLIA